uniref:peptidoglycan glycosyltransferase n=1 Tax=Paulinella chromatophora TaxID=39717 RepID=B1X3X4_PAUCH|nr:Cell division protein FtsW [Paulinella chromatophora]ACB42643.1 Cell division protein FtsW [Paulinella chromatophora]
MIVQDTAIIIAWKRIKLYRMSNLSLNKQSKIKIPWHKYVTEVELLGLLIMLWCLFGGFILISASWWTGIREMGDGLYHIKRQSSWLLAGSGLFTLAVRTRISFWLRSAPYAILGGTLLLIATLIVGSTINGASRWIIIGSLQIQPSELIKPFVILQSVNIFTELSKNTITLRVFWISAFGVIILLILKQPNLSTAATIGILIWLIAWAAGTDFKGLFITAIIGLFVGCASILLNQYQLIRVLSFIDPWKDANGNGHQLIQSLLALGSGGVFGQGYGFSIQKLQYLPIKETDFIFAIFGEEFGFMGSIMVLVFLFFFNFIGLRAAYVCKENKSRILVIGCTTLLVGQSIANIAVASGIMPTTGLPLPMVSYGGNSLLSSLFTAGLMVRCILESSSITANIYRRKVTLVR